MRYETLMNEIEAKNEKISEFRSILEEKEMRLGRLQSEVGYKDEEIRKLHSEIERVENGMRHK